MLIVILGAGVVAVLTATVGYFVGHRLGRADKLAELHALQDEGWLTITYTGKPESLLPEGMMTEMDDSDLADLPSTNRPTANRDERLKGLMMNEVSRPRRDSPERRDGYATAIKHGEPIEGEGEETEEDVLDFKD